LGVKAPAEPCPSAWLPAAAFSWSAACACDCEDYDPSAFPLLEPLSV